jgi:hypothetical protein
LFLWFASGAAAAAAKRSDPVKDGAETRASLYGLSGQRDNARRDATRFEPAWRRLQDTSTTAAAAAY